MAAIATSGSLMSCLSQFNVAGTASEIAQDERFLFVAANAPLFASRGCAGF